VKVRSLLFYGYLFFIVVYALFTLLPAPSRITLAQYHLSPAGLRIIFATIVLIQAFIWYAGFYGYTKLQAYANLIQGNKDGKQVAKLTRGIFLVVMWLPVSSVISVILSYYSRDHLGWIPAITIFQNYLSIILPLSGFIFISMGARGLSRLVRLRTSYLSSNILIIAVIYVGLIYYHLIASTANRTEVYHLSIWLILLTIVAPYIYMWSIGLMVAYEIYLYRKKIAGIVYRKSWSYLALGLAWLIVTSIGFQYLIGLVARLDKLSIYWVLAIIYSLLLVLSIGFILISVGTRKLQKIEEV
jgi:hypothetical protein